MGLIIFCLLASASMCLMAKQRDTILCGDLRDAFHKQGELVADMRPILIQLQAAKNEKSELVRKLKVIAAFNELEKFSKKHPEEVILWPEQMSTTTKELTQE